ncbi:MAG TPA: hydroxypyruvate isomerase [Telluria sp.]|jgi:hydroxypyruvate isomerase
MPKFAANLSLMFTEVPFLERFAAARGNGFEAVEFLFPYSCAVADIAERLARDRLQLVLHNLPAGDWDAGERGLACDPSRVDAFHDSVACALAYALPLGVRQLHCLAGLLAPGADAALAHDTYVANLRFAAARLAEHGLTLLIEPINTFDMPGYFLTSAEQAAAVIAEVDAPNLSLQYDIYHMQRMGTDVAAGIARHLPLIRHMQLADSPGRHEPGSGEIDYAALFSLIDRLGYQGWIGCEYHPQADTISGLGWRSSLLA